MDGGFLDAYVAIQTVGAPVLTIARADGAVTISWPDAGTGVYTLQRASVLGEGADWSSPNLAASLVEGNRTVTLTGPTGGRYFRLVKSGGS